MRILCIDKDDGFRAPLLVRLLETELRFVGVDDMVKLESAGWQSRNNEFGKKDIYKKGIETKIKVFAREVGVNLDDHRRIPIDALPLQEFDLILCVDSESHQQVKLKESRPPDEKIVLVGETGIPNLRDESPDDHRRVIRHIIQVVPKLIPMIEQMLTEILRSKDEVKSKPSE